VLLCEFNCFRAVACFVDYLKFEITPLKIRDHQSIVVNAVAFEGTGAV
jgi:hypothetical protein